MSPSGRKQRMTVERGGASGRLGLGVASGASFHVVGSEHYSALYCTPASGFGRRTIWLFSAGSGPAPPNPAPSGGKNARKVRQTV